MSSRNSNYIAEVSMGHFGVEYVSGTSSGAAGPWMALNMVTSTAFSALTIAGSTGTLTSVTFPAGSWIYGQITAFTLSSGSVLAYKGQLNA